ncbi:hypothetical protein [Pseudoteredinibacter isoporae]|uniref:hypothetical protein n=1 Tax=Pseudoteredinibacter isoporae TaxID=570281 RepID=UPI0033428085
MLLTKWEISLGFWYVLAVAYNVYAYYQSLNGDVLLATSQPIRGIIFISILMMVLSVRRVWLSLFKLVFPLCLLGLAYGGLINHWRYWASRGYSIGEESTALFIALSLNGVAVVCGFVLWWQQLRGDRS